MPVTPGKSLPTVLKTNVPVGHGGWIDVEPLPAPVESHLHRVAALQPGERIGDLVTLVPKSDAVFIGDPSCW